MPKYTDIVRSATAEKFTEMVSASSRKAREVYYHRHGIHAPKVKIPKAGAKNEVRNAKLYESVRSRDDDDMCEEILRCWLLTKRPMLAAALDHLGIPHQEGLTESEEVNKMSELSADAAKALVDTLTPVATPEDIAIYLRFMGVSSLDPQTASTAAAAG